MPRREKDRPYWRPLSLRSQSLHGVEAGRLHLLPALAPHHLLPVAIEVELIRITEAAHATQGQVLLGLHPVVVLEAHRVVEGVAAADYRLRARRRKAPVVAVVLLKHAG